MISQKAKDILHTTTTVPCIVYLIANTVSVCLPILKSVAVVEHCYKGVTEQPSFYSETMVLQK